ncbi:MAG: type 4a pilus biogenesis protein PilO [Planctomycetales bacterium]|nr:type 4a pilus biogenesis protein PilO [Planctomycetales bacterium]
MLSDRSNPLKLAAHAGGVGLCAVCALSIFLVVYRPLARSQQEHEAKISRLARLSRTADNIRRQHASLTSELAELREHTNEIHQRVPEFAEEADFLARVAEIAAVENLQITEYRRGNATESATHSCLEVGLNCTGSYTSICQFLDKVAALPRISSTKSALIRPADHTDRRSCDLVLELFYGMRPRESKTLGGQNG